MRTIRLASCHSDRKYFAKGLCRSCYDKQYIKTRLLDVGFREHRRAIKNESTRKLRLARSPEKILADREYQRLFKRRQREDPENRRLFSEAQKRWLAKNPYYERERSKRRWKENPEPLRRATNKYRLNNPDKAREFKKHWQENNREKYLLQMRSDVKRRKARIKGANISDFSEAQWNTMKIDSNYTCFYCHEVFEQGLTQDHMIPLSRGGDHTAANIVPACMPCNNRKKTKTTEEYVNALATV